MINITVYKIYILNHTHSMNLLLEFLYINSHAVLGASDNIRPRKFDIPTAQDNLFFRRASEHFQKALPLDNHDFLVPVTQYI